MRAPAPLRAPSRSISGDPAGTEGSAAPKASAPSPAQSFLAAGGNLNCQEAFGVGIEDPFARRLGPVSTTDGVLAFGCSDFLKQSEGHCLNAVAFNVDSCHSRSPVGFLTTL